MFYKNRVFIIFSIIFLSLMVGNYIINRSFTKEILVNEQIGILERSSSKIEKWIENKKLSLQGINSLIQNESPSDIEDILVKSAKISNFATIYAGYENGITISSKPFNRPKDYLPKNRPWYINTLKENKVYITKPYIDVGLKVPVISICEKMINSKNPIGVLCAILTFDDIKNEISDLKLENNGYVFLIDESHNILFHTNHNLKSFDDDIDISKPANYETKDGIFAVKPIQNSKLILIAKTPKKNIYNRINEQFLVNFIIYVFSVILFFILITIYNKISSNKDKMIYKTNKMLEMFANNTPKGILILSSKNDIIFFNKKLLKMLNTNCENYDVFLNAFPDDIKQKIENFMEQKSNIENSFDVNFQIKENYFRVQILGIFTELNYEGVILFLENISEQYKFNEYKKEHERMLFAQTKMAELGQMISAISHQWIQPLNSLNIFLGNLVQFKKLNRLDDEIFYDNINRSLKNIDYMSKTMNMFKNFYKFNDKKQTFNIKQVIQDTVFVLFSEHSFVEIKITCDKKINLSCTNYLNDFSQIMACLIQNSKQALKNCTRAKIIISIRGDKDFFLVRVIDNGMGIDENMKDKIFEPFLSTKNSSGLGLYISKLIVKKRCGGDLDVLKMKKPTIFLLKIKKRLDDD